MSGDTFPPPAEEALWSVVNALGDLECALPSRRDIFAVVILHAIAPPPSGGYPEPWGHIPPVLVEKAVKLADALIAELDKDVTS